MKVIQLATIFSSSISLTQAFAPNSNNAATIRTDTTLHAETLEGWKVNGQIKPVNNFILIEKAKEQSESDGGILLSNSVRNPLVFDVFSFIALKASHLLYKIDTE
jgi:hypothetical protein